MAGGELLLGQPRAMISILMEPGPCLAARDGNPLLAGDDRLAAMQAPIGPIVDDASGDPAIDAPPLGPKGPEDLGFGSLDGVREGRPVGLVAATTINPDR